jgi:hypothetical protein
MTRDERTIALTLSSAPAASIEPVRKDAAGLPVQRFRKELIRTGTFTKDADGVTFSVDRKTLDHWAATFSRMREAGYKAPVPVGHEGAADPEKNRGWLVDVYPEGDSLVGVIELHGEEAIKLAGVADTSIFTQKRFTDDKGQSYDWPILHVALCTDPVIQGLKPFERWLRRAVNPFWFSSSPRRRPCRPLLIPLPGQPHLPIRPKPSSRPSRTRSWAWSATRRRRPRRRRPRSAT